MRIIISNSSGMPIYEQIKEQIKEAILSGEVAEGDMLPSIRQLAKDLKISVITTTRAYNDLQQEGFVTNVQGKGCYVLPQNNDMIREQLLREIEESFINAFNKGRIAKISKSELTEMFSMMLEEENYE
ncbi:MULTISPECIES: GntR family transcriptional regulator [Clostridium]|uniref:GntR family transcriptional regulator n=1 Tax=Clostridium cadaveris TaxID=1529 RepID=A0A1I2M769_9CLOT|nr:GntR family transcriptional regulator [Clostridium cadaveris]MDU4951220.1 GntR family transcriptional regulator [Clostridium sp.]MDM8311454.1 GntR family transcriptional regulator [Clostridium cadaveris]MDY4950292.1 GntR family transcriptional regulator [Clostridium cadaveris]NME65535.1 GntR family transcriptional regulator [Clostridium cadaveris]NWK10158.1 GntR family transcriptional regulator [Clostridium cadaveris]